MKKLTVLLASLVIFFGMLVGVSYGDDLDSQLLAKEIRLEGIRTGNITAVDFLRDEIDFWGEFGKRLVECGNAIGVQYPKNRMLLGYDVSLHETDSLKVIAGIIPVENENADLFFGLQYKGFPLLGDLSRMFKVLDPGFVVVDGKLRFCLSFEWRAEEIQKRLED